MVGRRGLFTKFVVSFVGLVVLVLTVNGAVETWFMYRETRLRWVNAQSERAASTARRIEQLLLDIERQVSWVTRAKRRHHRAASIGLCCAAAADAAVDALVQLRRHRSRAAEIPALPFCGQDGHRLLPRSEIHRGGCPRRVVSPADFHGTSRS